MPYVLPNQYLLKWKFAGEEPMNTCIVSVGSNIDPEKNISRVVELLFHEFNVIQVSEWLRTAPVGIINQADFLNGAVKIETIMEMEQLRQCLKKLEDRLGRDRRQPKFGPRCIDLDILIWNGEIVDKDYYTRDFLRKSAAELGFPCP